MSPRPRGGYRNSKGVQLPGVTTVISRFKDSGPLIRWAFTQGKKGLDDLYEESDQAADIGTYAHALFEDHRKKEAAREHGENVAQWPLLLPPSGMSGANVGKAETSYLNALEWAKQVKLESVATEISLVCECYQYGATLDEIARINGQLADFEWKTSNAIYVDHLLQIAAQKHVWECNHPDQPLAGAGVIRFPKEFGGFGYHWYDDLKVAFAQFVRFRECYQDDFILRRMV